MSRFEIIKGVVKDLKIAKGFEDFIFSDQDRATAGIAAVSAGILEQNFNSYVLANANGGAEIDMELFTCSVNGKSIIGRFHEVAFLDDEIVEFVGNKRGDMFICHAARSESQRMIWMLPYQTRGQIAHRRNDVKWTLILSFGATVAVALSEFFIFQRHLDSTVFEQACVLMGIFVSVVLVNIFARYHLDDFSKDATDVIRTFGYSKPSEVDLYKIHGAAQKKILQETKSSPPPVAQWSFRY